MVFPIFFSVTILVLLAFVLKRKRLHLFEIIFLWIVITFLYQSMIASITINLKLWEVSTDINLMWTLVFSRLILIPILIMWFIDLLIKHQKGYMKGMLLLILVALMVAVDYLFDFVGATKHLKWTIWMSFLTWLSLILVTQLLHKAYRTVLENEVKL